MTEDTKKEVGTEESLRERTKRTSSMPAYFRAGAFSSVDLKNAPENLPPFMPKDWAKVSS
ncbi:MAG TPA: hypothetical protein VMY36_04295 [Patescibacteria group bacterium]|nr:hypothetical protein [Patescibacteria group bacterium]